MPGTYKKTSLFLSSPFLLLNDFTCRAFLVTICALFCFVVVDNPLFKVPLNPALNAPTFMWVSMLIIISLLGIMELIIRPYLQFNLQTVGAFLLWLCFEILILNAIALIISRFTTRHPGQNDY